MNLLLELCCEMLIQAWCMALLFLHSMEMPTLSGTAPVDLSFPITALLQTYILHLSLVVSLVIITYSSPCIECVMIAWSNNYASEVNELNVVLRTFAIS